MTTSFPDRFIPFTIVDFPSFNFPQPTRIPTSAPLLSLTATISKVLHLYLSPHFHFHLFFFHVINSLTISNFKSLQQPLNELPTFTVSLSPASIYPSTCVAVYCRQNFRSFPINSQIHPLISSMFYLYPTLRILFPIILLQRLHISTLDYQLLQKHSIFF